MLRLHAPETSASSTTLPAIVAVPMSEREAVPCPHIDAYIAELSVGLSRFGTSHAVQTCEEIRQHLQASMQAQMELGDTVEVAEAEALRRFGAIEETRRAVVGELHRNDCRKNPETAFRFALSTYGAFMLLDVICAAYLSIPHTMSMSGHIDPYWMYAGPLWMLLLPPILAGWRVGQQTGGLAVRATSRAFPALIAALFLGITLIAFAPSIVDFYTRGSFSGQQSPFIGALLNLAWYNVVRFPLSLLTAGIAGRRRSTLLRGKG